MGFRKHYVLKIYVENIELREKYNEHFLAHNEDVVKIISGDNSIYCDAGIDLFCPENTNFSGITTTKLDHKIKCAMEVVETNDGNPFPVGYKLFPRSSTGTKTPLRLSNSTGIIDSGYRGNIISVFDNIKEDNYEVSYLQRIVQLCPPDLTYPTLVVLVEDEKMLGITSRGSGGFGSTGS